MPEVRTATTIVVNLTLDSNLVVYTLVDALNNR